MAMNEGRVHGYEYDYRFSTVDDFDESQDEAYHFEIRTNFILKKHNETITLCSEYFRVYEETLLFLDVTESKEPESGLEIQLIDRLREYWMLDHEVNELSRKAIDYFASANNVTPEGGGFVVPVVVHLDVLTVQRDDEGAGPAFDRAIRVESLVPLRFYRGLLDIPSNEDEDTVVCVNKQYYLIHHMPRTRVIRVGSAEACCSICLGESRVGDRISVLDRTCNHAFHYHCIATWLMKNDTCPLCRRRDSNASCDGLDCCRSEC